MKRYRNRSPDTNHVIGAIMELYRNIKQKKLHIHLYTQCSIGLFLQWIYTAKCGTATAEHCSPKISGMCW